MASDFGEVMFQALSVDDVVDSIVAGLDSGSFIIAPNDQPMAMFRAKATDYDGFLGNLQQRVQVSRVTEQLGTVPNRSRSWLHLPRI